jgi:UDP-2,4-diacetamido-2,4,6-trideoxy-beta-L-altropyranose hydrolase
MRCLTLAEELRDAGAEVSFISRVHQGNLNDLIRGKGFRCHELPEVSAIQTSEQHVRDHRSEYASWLGVSQQQDAQETIEAIGATRADWLIVDHYGLDEEWEKILRPHATKIMVIDDLADRSHDCDLLLDQNLFIDGEKRYNDLVSPACTKLLGPKYALLRNEFRDARTNLRERTGEVKRVLVFLGGADPENITGMAMEVLSDPELLHLQVDVVIGSQNLHQEKIQKLVQARHGTTLHIQTTNMAELMSAADLAIGAGGSTTWERLFLGIPSIIIPIAKNQVLSTRNLCELGIIMSPGECGKISVNRLKNVILSMIDKPQDLLKMSKNGIKIVSCNGLKELTELLAGRLNGIKISRRNATLGDCKLYLEWVNDPEVRENAFNSNPIPWEVHQEWFAARVNDPKS